MTVRATLACLIACLRVVTYVWHTRHVGLPHVIPALPIHATHGRETERDSTDHSSE